MRPSLIARLVTAWISRAGSMTRPFRIRMLVPMCRSLV